MKHIDPAVKFLCLLALTIVLAWKYSLSPNCAVFFGGVAAMLCCGVSLKKLALLLAPIFALALAGLTVGGMIFNTMNEKLGGIYSSWLTHMFANFAINTIGFMLLA